MRLCALSVDLDEVPCYTAIYGLDPPPDERAHAMYRRALPRFEELFDELDVPATFFAIGHDLADPAAAEAIARLHAAGHEIANHTFHHRYDLTRVERPQMVEDVREGQHAIERITGRRPVGFRAPGYTVTDTLLGVLSELGVEYDSSVFPCPAYYTAKTLAIGAIAARGRQSHSVVDHPGVLLSPADPYRIGTPYRRRGDGLLELPIAVTRGPSGRLPYIGTYLALGGPTLARWLTRLIVGRPLVNLEMHPIDLADADLDDLTFLRPFQPDLKRTLAPKRAALRAAIETLRDDGYEFVTLAEAARRFG